MLVVFARAVVRRCAGQIVKIIMIAIISVLQQSDISTVSVGLIAVALIQVRTVLHSLAGTIQV